MPILTVELSHPDLPEAAGLIDALSDHLLRHYGADGRASFGAWGAAPARSAFVLARSSGIAVACGAIRPLDGDDAEVKRMYATPGYPGAAAAVLGLLEAEALRLGYRTLRLATRRANDARSGSIASTGSCPARTMPLTPVDPRACAWKSRWFRAFHTLTEAYPAFAK